MKQRITMNNAIELLLSYEGYDINDIKAINIDTVSTKITTIEGLKSLDDENPSGLILMNDNSWFEKDSYLGATEWNYIVPLTVETVRNY